MYSACTDNRQETRFKLITAGSEEKLSDFMELAMVLMKWFKDFAVAIKMGATKADFDATVAIHLTASEEFVTMR